MFSRKNSVLWALLAAHFAVSTMARAVEDPLPSWSDTSAKKAIVAFVESVTKEGTAAYVPARERIATFDNDRTLWAEQPMYTQFYFAMDRVKALADKHPEWTEQEPYSSILKGDIKGALATGVKGMLDVVTAAQSGMTTEEFSALVSEWLATAKHPVTHRPFTGMVYQPMLELLDYLRANAFKTYIVSGGGVEFMRPWTERVYGIPPEQVIGSSIKTAIEMRDNKLVVVRLPQIQYVDDKENKVLAIDAVIGRRPIASFGNSDGDLQMLQYTDTGDGPRLCVYVHHTDAEREFAYDRQSPVGRLDKGLDEAQARGWTVVSIKEDWKTVFAE